MKRLIVVGISIGIVGASMSWYYWQPDHKERAIDYIDQELQVYKTLNFSLSSKLITVLCAYRDELYQTYKPWNMSWFSDQMISKETLDNLIAINTTMLKSYVQDLQDYMKKKLSPSDTLMQFTYDKVVRLTIALAQLEKNDVIYVSEYAKKIARMCEITKQAIMHSKKMLRSYLHNGLPDNDDKVHYERMYLTDKVEHFIALDRMQLLCSV